MTRSGKVKFKSVGRGCETERDTDDQGEGLLRSGKLDTQDLVLACLEVAETAGAMVLYYLGLRALNYFMSILEIFRPFSSMHTSHPCNPQEKAKIQVLVA